MQTYQIPDNPFGYVNGNIEGWSESKKGLLNKDKVEVKCLVY